MREVPARFDAGNKIDRRQFAAQDRWHPGERGRRRQISPSCCIELMALSIEFDRRPLPWLRFGEQADWSMRRGNALAEP
jgi:hypothetical protein